VKRFQQIDTIHVRHVHVTQHQIELALRHQFDRAASVARFGDQVTTATFEHCCKCTSNLGLIIDDQHPRLGHVIRLEEHLGVHDGLATIDPTARLAIEQCLPNHGLHGNRTS
jgi:hypothetical protein